MSDVNIDQLRNEWQQDTSHTGVARQKSIDELPKLDTEIAELEKEFNARRAAGDSCFGQDQFGRRSMTDMEPLRQKLMALRSERRRCQGFLYQTASASIHARLEVLENERAKLVNGTKGYGGVQLAEPIERLRKDTTAKYFDGRIHTLVEVCRQAKSARGGVPTTGLQDYTRYIERNETPEQVALRAIAEIESIQNGTAQQLAADTLAAREAELAGIESQIKELTDRLYTDPSVDEAEPSVQRPVVGAMPSM